MLYNFGTVDKIKRLFTQILDNPFIRGQDLESSLWTVLPSYFNALFRKVDPHDTVASPRKLGGNRAVTTTNVENARARRKIGAALQNAGKKIRVCTAQARLGVVTGHEKCSRMHHAQHLTTVLQTFALYFCYQISANPIFDTVHDEIEKETLQI